jgi:N-methylhydantoinase A
VVSWRVRTLAPPAVSAVRVADEVADQPALIERRMASFVEFGGFVETPVYARTALPEGMRIEGPALIEETESTAVVGPSAHAMVDEFGNIIMRLAGND